MMTAGSWQMTAGSYFFFPTTGWQATVAMVKPLGVQVIDAEEDFLENKHK